MKQFLGTTLDRLTGRTKRFAGEEDGVMAPQILFFFLMMILVGGVAVDVMRFETRRVAVQQTMDRATLAAANLNQTLTPLAVVNDYFAKAELTDDLDSVTVTQGANYRIVQAKATVTSGNYFMSMMDVPYLEAQNRSQAEQRITNVEIALVLDVSGSMYNNIARINNLKTAAKNFVDKVFLGDTQNKISMAIVPYNGQVNLGPTLVSKFNVTNPHALPVSQPNGQPGKSYCLDLPTSTYSSTELSRTTPMTQTPFVDTWSGTTTSNVWTSLQGPSYDATRQLYSNVWCSPVAGNYVQMHTNNKDALKTHIDNLVAIGATSIDLGMKWGTFFLDPSSRSITAEMVGGAATDVPAIFSGRPAAYSDNETLKVIVLMTDGENFTQERVGTDYRNQLSPIWRSTGDGQLSIQHTSGRPACAGTNQYWIPHRWNSDAATQPCGNNAAWQAAPWNSGGGVTQLTWQEVWAIARTDWVAFQLYAKALGVDAAGRSAQYLLWEGGSGSATNGNFRSYAPTTTMNTRLDEICETAKGQGMLVFGIALEAPAGGKAAIEDCTSSPTSTYYYESTSGELSTAFDQIASTLSQLRLTQ